MKEQSSKLERVGQVAIAVGVFSLIDYFFYLLFNDPMDFGTVALFTGLVFVVKYVEGEDDG